MNIISHRGFWRTREEKNSNIAFIQSLECGFGTETDVRDHIGDLVVSHDPPTGGDMSWSDLLAMFNGRNLPLAVNVKSDGLGPRLQASFSEVDIPWYAFDMSGPETVRFARLGLPFFTRHSDVEPQPILYEQAHGVWLDDFSGDWIDCDIVRRHLNCEKPVCIVSSELHGRDPEALWERLAVLEVDAAVTLCTDRPDLAKRVFGL